MATALIPNLPVVHRDVIAGRIADLEHQLQVERDALAAAIPQEPTQPYSVIRFIKYTGAYTFAAIRAYDAADGGRWFLTQDGEARTGRQHIGSKTWAQLLEFIGERNWTTIEVLS